MKLLVPLKKSALCLFLAAFVWSGCDRKKEPAAEAPSRAAAPGASAATADAAAGKPVAAANPLIANADRLGMAGRMPKDTGLYLGSANLKAHCDALKKTQYWKTIEAFRQDSKPSETKKKKASKLPEFEDLEIDDFFMAMSKDSKAHMAWLIDLNRVYGEYTYRTMMTGFTGGGGAGAFDPQAMLANASASPEMIERICSLLERAEMLPLLAGAKTPQAQQLLDAIAPANADERPEWTRTLTPGTFTANTGAKLTTYEGTLGIWLTPAVREEWLAGIQKSITQEALVTRIKQTLETLAAKKFVIGAGISDGYLLVAAGTDLKHVSFAAKPEESLLARPDLAVAAPHAAKNILGLFHYDGDLLTAIHDDQPLTPLLQAALSGLAGAPIFSALTQQLEPKVAALGEAEKAFNQYTFVDANGVFWWDEGLHMDMSGGVAPDKMIMDQPLQFAPLLDAPDFVFAAMGHSPASVTGRAYFEKWMDFLYTAVGGFVQAGMGGDQALGIYGMVDKGVIPPLVNIYNASKTLYQKGLGTESALVLDLKGQTPLLPGAPDAAEGTGGAIPRLAALHNVVDRKSIADSWKTIEVNLNQILKSLPTPMPPMAPMSSQNNGMTTWFYPIPIGGNDVLPCVTLNDKFFMFGTSMNLHNELAEKLAAAPAAKVTGSHYRFSFAPVRTFLKNSAALPGAAAEEITTALPFLAPFGDLRGRAWVEGGQLRNTFHLEIKDVRQVD